MRSASILASLGLLTLALPPAWAMTAAQQLPVDYVRVSSLRFADLRSRLPADTDSTQALACGDLDGDGDLDLFLGHDGASARERQNALYLNTGNAKFSNATGQLPADTDATMAVACGDVDGDGDLDLLLGNEGQNRLYLNDGAAFFSDAPGQLPTDADSSYAISLGDVDGDGDLDAFIGNFWFQQNKLYLNDGTGVFTDATFLLPLDSDPSMAVAMGDVDGDGDLDVIVGNGFDGIGVQNRLYLNAGGGNFFDATAQLPPDVIDTAALALGDVDGDGDLDILVGNGDRFLGAQETNQLYLNDGSGVFSDAGALIPQEAQNTTAVVLGDVDGDGDLDALIGNSGYPWLSRLYLNDGSGSFSDGSFNLPGDAERTGAVVLADLDGDGDLDAVFGNLHGEQNRLYLNGGSGNFEPSGFFPADTDCTQALALGDLDGDGDLDILLGNQGLNGLYMNDGTGRYSDSSSLLPADSDFTTAVALGDIDGDGDLDALIGNFWGQANRLYLNDGTGAFSDASFLLPPFADSTAAIALADVDGDGDLDAFIGNGNGQENRLYLNDGGGNFVGPLALLPAHSDPTCAVAFGDVDGDGDPDILIGNCFSFGGPVQNRLYRNNGNGSFTDATASLPAIADLTLAVAFGDVDGDGDLDAIIGNGGINGADPRNLLYVNDGTGTFSDALVGFPADFADTRAIALADVDGDGDLDVLFGNAGSYGRQNTLLLNDGLGRFSDATELFPSLLDETYSIALADVDGDGDPDAVIGNCSWHQNRFYRNLLR